MNIDRTGSYWLGSTGGETCLVCSQPVVDRQRCRVHLDVFQRMQRAFPTDPRETAKERRFESRVSR